MSKDRLIRIWLLVAIYAAIIAASFYLSYEIRFDFVVPPEHSQTRVNLIIYVVGLTLLSLVCTKQVRTLITFFGVPDLFKITIATTAISAILLVGRLSGWPPISISRGVILVNYLVCTAGLCCFRLGARLFRERASEGHSASKAPSTKVAIIGAGRAGASVAREFLSSPNRGYRPVAFFDDDLAKKDQLLHGIRVLGPAEMIPMFVEAYGFTEVVIALPPASRRRIRQIVEIVSSQQLKVETIPPLEELASGRVKVSRIRPVAIEDLLGRDPVELDHSAIKDSIAGKVVMVTGSAGSIGSELCRQIAAFNPTQLLLLDQSEGGLFYLEQELIEKGYSSFIVPLVADILDDDRTDSIFKRYMPQTIFHAAAYKHVHLMERQYREAFRNNTIGTRKLASCAARHNTSTFVLISTDKAVNPASVMGVTKRLAELQIQMLQARPENRTRFIAVRFGNVLGSSGSVVPIFRKQITDGGPITVTHQDAERYFMTIPEAAGLVLQASILGVGGEIFTLDMGKPIRIFDLAKQMLTLSGLRLGEDIEIRYIGLRPGEKLTEEIHLNSEEYLPTAHSRISKFVANGNSVTAFDDKIARIEKLSLTLSKNDFARELMSVVPEYEPHSE